MATKKTPAAQKRKQAPAKSGRQAAEGLLALETARKAYGLPHSSLTPTQKAVIDQNLGPGWRGKRPKVKSLLKP